MYKEIKYSDYSKELLGQLAKGAFLTTASDKKINTMTIGWGSLGYMWNKPVFIAMVRHSRYTNELMEKSNDFTVSFPLNGQLKKELGYCGTKSGRDVDKIKECNLSFKKGDTVNSPVIEGCNLYLECKTVYIQSMNESTLDDKIKHNSYSTGDYHVLYYGEILKAYINDK